jgi:predicted metal-dependent peptidase
MDCRQTGRIDRIGAMRRPHARGVLLHGMDNPCKEGIILAIDAASSLQERPMRALPVLADIQAHQHDRQRR